MPLKCPNITDQKFYSSLSVIMKKQRGKTSDAEKEILAACLSIQILLDSIKVLTTFWKKSWKSSRPGCQRRNCRCTIVVDNNPSSCQLHLLQPVSLFRQRRQCSHCSGHVEQLLVEPLRCIEVRQGLNATRRYMLIRWQSNAPFRFDYSLHQGAKCHGVWLC